MARLNESTAPTESVEILKRRFVRQNREIARVNSIQSLRIRSLEAEVSHLLSENVSLREQMIALNQALERFEAAKVLSDGVHEIKAKLDAKLLELSALMTDLGALPRNFNKAQISKSDAPGLNSSRTSGSGTSNNGQDRDFGTMFEARGRLPAILEDKYYPRRTLEPHELQQVMPDDADKPIPHDSNSPMIQAFSKDEHVQTETLGDDVGPEHFGNTLDGSEEALSPTLETRENIKADTSLLGESLQQVNTVSSPVQRDSRMMLKSGAKRKFSAQDDRFETISADDDDFQFCRTTQSPQHTSQPDTVSGEHYSPIKKQVQPKTGVRSHVQAKRKALEPKSTNLNMTSPNARRNTIENAKAKDAKDIEVRSAENNGIYTDLPLAQGPGQCIDPATTHYVEGENSTSLSPHISSPSLEPGTSGLLNAASRPSRRRGAVVSYAEPNLRDKMRRPTSEFIAAVGNNQSRRSSNSQAANEQENCGSDDNKTRKPINRKSQNSAASGTEPDLAVTGRFNETSRHSLGMVSQRKRKTSPVTKDDHPPDYESPAKTTCYETSWTAGASAQVSPDDGFDNEVQPTDIVACMPPATVGMGMPRQSRRHSSNHQSSKQEALCQSGMTTSRLESQRCSFSREDSRVSVAFASDEDSVPRDGEMHTLNHMFTQPSNSSTTITGPARRGQRAAARRRSMIL